MTISFWQRSLIREHLSCDVAIVGGGITGCSTAYWLSQERPDLRLILLDAGKPGSGATGRNAGFLLQGTSGDYLSDIVAYGADRTRQIWHFTRENRDLIFSDLDGSAFELEESGSMTVAATAEEDERLRSCVSRMRADGAPAAYLPPEETNRRLGSTGFSGSLYVPSGAMLNPLAFIHYLIERSGVTIRPYHAVASVQEVGGRVLLETENGTVEAGQVVLALNAYLPRLLPELSVLIRPVRAQMLATAPLASRWLRYPAYTHRGFMYIRQAQNGSILLGGARHLHLEEEVGYEDQTTAALQADLEAYLHKHFPKAKGAKVSRRWSGTMAFTADRLPLIGGVPGIDGSFWAGGYSGHGMSFGFRLGKLLADLIQGKPDPEGYNLFSVDRLSKKGREHVKAE